MDDILVDITNDNFIVINKNKVIKTDNLFSSFKKSYFDGDKIGDYKIENFEKLNTAMNRGDSIKDGTSSSTLINLDLFSKYDDLFDFNDMELKSIEHHVLKKCLENGTIVLQTFTKDKLGDDSVKKHYVGFEYAIGFDSGLGIKHYLQEKDYSIVTTFGKYIDPSTKRDYNEYFPKGSLSISQNMLENIGYTNCAIIQSKNIGVDNYQYQMKIGSVDLANTASRNSDNNIKTIFVGNQKKKGVIDNPKIKTDVKRAMVVGKGMGDKLQVFILFIKKLLEKRKVVSISTCDGIVFLFSILLELPCFFTSKEKTNDSNKRSVKRIMYYNPDNINPDSSKKRFENEKKIVIEKYKELIQLIRTVMSQKKYMYVSGDSTKTYSFSESFYKGVLDDLVGIQNYVEKQDIKKINEISDINRATDKIKKLTPIQIFKKRKDGNVELMYSASKYTNSTDYSINQQLKPKLAVQLKCNEKEIRNASFFFIATKFLANRKMNGGSLSKTMYSRSKSAPMNSLSSKSKSRSRSRSKSTSRYSPGMDSFIFDSQDSPHSTQFEDIFDTEPIMVYLKPDEEDGISEFDANLSFRQEVENIYVQLDRGKIDSEILFFDVYSELLCELEYDPDYSTESLTIKIQRIKDSILDTKNFEDQIFSNTFVLQNKSNRVSKRIDQYKPSVFNTKNRTQKKQKSILTNLLKQSMLRNKTIRSNRNDFENLNRVIV
jgi:hypothetical protein